MYIYDICVCIYIYIYVYIRIYIYTYTYVSMHAFIIAGNFWEDSKRCFARMRIVPRTHVCRLFFSLLTYSYRLACESACVCVCVCVCIRARRHQSARCNNNLHTKIHSKIQNSLVSKHVPHVDNLEKAGKCEKIGASSCTERGSCKLCGRLMNECGLNICS